MKYVRKVLAATVVVSAMLSGVAYAQQTATQCKRTCSNTYTACQKAKKDENKCLSAWVACKKKCDAPKK